MRTALEIAFLIACLWIAWHDAMELLVGWYSGGDPDASRMAIATLALRCVAALVAAIATGVMMVLARE